MKIIRLLIFIQAAQLMVLLPVVVAGESVSLEKLKSSIFLEVSVDEATRQSAIELDYNFINNTNFNMRLARSKIKDQEVEDDITNEFIVGLGMDNRQLLSAGVEYEYWGLTDVLIVENLYLPLQLKIYNWRFGFRFGQGEIEFDSVEFLNQTRHIDAKQITRSYSLGYSGLRNWDFSFHYDNHSYSKDISVLSGPVVSLFFTEGTLSLASGLVNESVSARAVYQFAKFDLGFQAQASESAYDYTESHSGAGSFDYYLNEKWSCSVVAGKTTYENDPVTGGARNPNHFLSLGLRYIF